MTVQNHMIRSNTTTSTTQEFYITTVGEWNQWNVKCFQIILNPVCIEILPCWMDRKIVTYLCFLYIAVHPIHAYHCEPWQVPSRNNALWWWLIWVSLKIAYPQRKSMVYQQFSYLQTPYCGLQTRSTVLCEKNIPRFQAWRVLLCRRRYAAWFGDGEISSSRKVRCVGVVFYH